MCHVSIGALSPLDVCRLQVFKAPSQWPGDAMVTHDTLLSNELNIYGYEHHLRGPLGAMLAWVQLTSTSTTTRGCLDPRGACLR